MQISISQFVIPLGVLSLSEHNSEGIVSKQDYREASIDKQLHGELRCRARLWYSRKFDWLPEPAGTWYLQLHLPSFSCAGCWRKTPRGCKVCQPECEHQSASTAPLPKPDRTHVAKGCPGTSQKTSLRNPSKGIPRDLKEPKGTHKES